MQTVQIILSLAILGMLIVIYKEVKSLDPVLRSVGKTTNTVNSITSFLGL